MTIEFYEWNCIVRKQGISKIQTFVCETLKIQKRKRNKTSLYCWPCAVQTCISQNRAWSFFFRHVDSHLCLGTGKAWLKLFLFNYNRYNEWILAKWNQYCSLYDTDKHILYLSTQVDQQNKILTGKCIFSKKHSDEWYLFSNSCYHDI